MRTPTFAGRAARRALIRHSTPGDLDALVRILGESPEAASWTSEALLEQGIGGSQVWVAELDGMVVGFLAGRLAANEFEILNLAVARSHRRRRVASHLVQAALEAGRAAGARRAYLEVRASNTAAIALYGNLGFAENGRRQKYYREPLEDAVLMFRIEPSETKV